MSIQLNWTNRAIGTGINVYRSETAFDADTLPAVLDSIAAGSTSYVDATVVEDTTYFYAVGIVDGARIALSSVVEILAEAGDGGGDPPPVGLTFTEDFTDNQFFDYGDAYLRYAKTSTIARNAIGWDLPGEHADVEVLAKILTDGPQTFGVVVRGSYPSSNEQGIALASHTTRGYEIETYANGSFSSFNGTGSADTPKRATWYWFRLRAIGTAIKGKVWRDGDDEPAAWTIEITNSNVTAAGKVGLKFNAGVLQRIFCDYYSVGVDGAVAPSPGDTPATGQYVTDFSAVGSDSDWSALWNVANAISRVAQADVTLPSTDFLPREWNPRWAVGGVATAAGEIGQQGGNSRALFAYKDAGRPTNVDLLALYKVNAGTNAQFGLLARGAGKPASETGYIAEFFQSATKQVQIRSLLNGTLASVTSAPYETANGELHWLRFRIVGDLLQVKAWLDGTAEPASWLIETTNATISTAGLVGVGSIGSSVLAYITDFQCEVLD